MTAVEHNSVGFKSLAVMVVVTTVLTIANIVATAVVVYRLNHLPIPIIEVGSNGVACYNKHCLPTGQHYDRPIQRGDKLPTRQD